jgi:hypothetical protein
MDLRGFAILTFALMTVIGATEVGSDAQAQIQNTLTTVYCIMTSIIPFIGFVLMVLAAVSYGFGQFFGADTRAKATTWGMACLTGAIVMLLIFMIGPLIIKGLYPAAKDIVCAG